MATNLIQNAAFSQGLTNWLQYTWYPDNTVCALSSGGHNGACVKLTVRSIGDPGQSYIYQPVHLTGGESYTLSFYAKRTGNVDIWAQVSSAHGTHYSPSFIPTLSQDGAYTKLSFSFTADGNSGDTISTTIKLIAGSAGGDAWFDTVELVADSDDGTGGTNTENFVIGDLVEISVNDNGVRVRPTASTSLNYIGLLHDGTLMLCDGTQTTSDGTVWVKVKWGGNGNSTGYVHSDFVHPTSIRPSNKMDAAIRIANSMDEKGYTGPNLGLTDQNWCVQYVSFLMQAAGCSSNNYVPFDDACVSEACNFFRVRNAFGEIDEKTPTVGDWVFFSQAGETYQHVGLVVSVNGATITTVEGNLGSTVMKRSGNYQGYFGEMGVYGFATPVWM